MDFIDQIRELSLRVPKLKDVIKTEEGTKNALVMPFITILGYNVSDPFEVTPELIADVGVKKGEKVDYAILKDGKPIMLFECKSHGATLSRDHASQLYRYFSVHSVRFGILTDGVIYQFYTDLDKTNVLDNQPFFVFDMSDLKDRDVEELKRFTKSAFDVGRILSSASELKYKGAIKQLIAEQFINPNKDFVRFFASQLKPKPLLTQSAMNQFTDITKQALRLYISEQIESRLKNALQQEAEVLSAEQKQLSKEDSQSGVEDKGIVTSEDEREGHRIIKAILREVVDVKRVALRDAKSYCAILFDDNNRKTICRLRFGSAKKQIGIMGAPKPGEPKSSEPKAEEVFPLESLDDIYKYADQLKAIALYYNKSAEA